MSDHLEAIHVAIGCVCATDDLEEKQKVRVLRTLEKMERTTTDMVNDEKS